MEEASLLPRVSELGETGGACGQFLWAVAWLGSLVGFEGFEGFGGCKNPKP